MNRAEAIDILTGLYCVPVENGADEFAQEINKAIDMAIEALRIGTWRWVDFWTEDRARTKHGIQCSECGECREWNDPYVFPSYCDECGAKMEGIENE